MNGNQHCGKSRAEIYPLGGYKYYVYLTNRLNTPGIGEIITLSVHIIVWATLIELLDGF